MTKSYKMIVLLYMLERGVERWNRPVTPNEMAGFFHKYISSKEYRRQIDFSDKESLRLWEWNDKTEAKVTSLIAEMPMSKWANAKGSQTKFKDGLFFLDVEIAEEDRGILYHWTEEVCSYRLHVHFERRA